MRHTTLLLLLRYEAAFGVFVPSVDEHGLGGAVLLVGESPVESGQHMRFKLAGLGGRGREIWAELPGLQFISRLVAGTTHEWDDDLTLGVAAEAAVRACR